MARTKKRERDEQDESSSSSSSSSVVDLTEPSPSPPKKKKKPPPKNKLPTGEVPFILGPSAAKEGQKLLLVEAPSLDLANDAGAVGRVNVKDDALRLDLKGLEHDATLTASSALLVVAVNEEQAKAEAVVSEFARVSCTTDGLRHINDALIEGNLDSYFHNDLDVNKAGGQQPPPKGKKKKKNHKAATTKTKKHTNQPSRKKK